MLGRMSGEQTERQIFIVRLIRVRAAEGEPARPWRAHVQNVETGQITLLETPGQMVDYFLGHTQPPPPAQGLK